jgi:pimeloyl-[acyl-carrier protein] methyl ester esterase
MSKPTRIFLLIGLTKESAHWDDVFVASLKEKFNTEDVVAIDLPGAGKYLDQKSPLSMEGVVKETRLNYQEYLKGDTHNIMVSISLGGMVATEWMKFYPTDFEKFVIVNSSFKGFSKIYKRVQPWAMQKFFKVFLAGTEEEREHHVIDLCSNNADVYDHTKKKWVKLAKERPMAKINMVRQLIAGARYSPDHKPEIPTLIIAAKHDKLAHYTCSENLHKKWGGDFHLIDDEKVGHGVHIDAPKQLASIIYEWASK